MNFTIPEIENYELEEPGFYVRISVDPDEIQDEDVEICVRKVLLALCLVFDDSV